MIKQKKTFFSITLGLVAVSLLGWYVATSWDDFSKLSIINPWALILAVLTVIISLYSAGMVNDLAMEPHNVHPSKREVFALAAATRFLNQIAPNYIGATLRAVFFKKHYAVSYSKFSSSFVVANLLQILISCALAVIFYVVISGGIDRAGNLIVVFLVSIFLGAALLIPAKFLGTLVSRLYEKYNNKFLKHVVVALEGYEHVRSYPGIYRRMLLWMTTLTSLSGVVILVLYYSLGYNISIAEAIFIAGVTNLSIILSVTPAGLGIREGMLVFSSSIIGIPIVPSLAVSILFRIVTALSSGLVSLAFLRTLAYRK